MIKIQNIYYMLAYAFKILQGKERTKLACERFENTADLLAAILAKGVSKEVKRGLGKEYVACAEPLSTLRGKIDITQSIKEQTLLKKKLFCHYDTFSINTKFNQIIKSCIMLLLKPKIELAKEQKRELKKLLPYFLDVETIDLFSVNWNMRFNRNNLNYQLLIGICELIVCGHIQKDEQGKLKFQKFVDTQNMCKLYEKFILAYYKKHLKDYAQQGIFIKVTSPKIQWQVKSDDLAHLPEMQSDIIIAKEDGSALIIDAKYYSRTMQSKTYCDKKGLEYSSKKKLHSHNLYQIFSYVKNAQHEKEYSVSGMLLYAKTDEEISPNAYYNMCESTILVKTLDLNQDFESIKTQLNTIVFDWYFTSSSDSLS